jgi:hypothetical protein
MYNTIVLEMLRQRRMAYDLKQNQEMLSTVKRLALDLKERHEACKSRLSQAQPGSDETQISSEALEIAVKELADDLASNSQPAESEPLSLEGAMAYIRRHTPPA